MHRTNRSSGGRGAATRRAAASWPLGLLVGVACVVVGSGPAAAQGSAPKASLVSTPQPLGPTDEAPPIFEVGVGLRAGGGGLLWSKPSETELFSARGIPADQGFEVPMFHENRGGWTADLGLFAQLRFLDVVGLEVGVYWARHSIVEQVDWSYVEEDLLTGQTFQSKASSTHTVSWTSLHVPILLRAWTPGDVVRGSFGLGVDLAFASWAETHFEVDTGEIRGPRSALETLNAQLEDSIYLTAVLGLEVDLGELFIPIEIWAGYNVSQPATYLERVDLDRLPDSDDQLADDATAKTAHPTEVTVGTRETLVGALRIGVGYRF